VLNKEWIKIHLILEQI